MYLIHCSLVQNIQANFYNAENNAINSIEKNQFAYIKSSVRTYFKRILK